MGRSSASAKTRGAELGVAWINRTNCCVTACFAGLLHANTLQGGDWGPFSGRECRKRSGQDGPRGRSCQNLPMLEPRGVNDGVWRRGKRGRKQASPPTAKETRPTPLLYTPTGCSLYDSWESGRGARPCTQDQMPNATVSAGRHQPCLQAPPPRSKAISSHRCRPSFCPADAQTPLTPLPELTFPTVAYAAGL